MTISNSMSFSRSLRVDIQNVGTFLTKKNTLYKLFIFSLFFYFTLPFCCGVWVMVTKCFGFSNKFKTFKLTKSLKWHFGCNFTSLPFPVPRHASLGQETLLLATNILQTYSIRIDWRVVEISVGFTYTNWSRRCCRRQRMFPVW